MFSGIEAASVAWNHLGWKAAAFCEIEPFPSAVLSHHYPNVPNLGDVTKADFDAIGHVDVVVFGSPCQTFSVAGKRLGLDDPRGNLALLGGRVVYHKRPRWFVFENVPGLLSSNGGWDFGTLLAAFAGHKSGSVFAPPEGGWRNSGVVKQARPDGYGLAYRVLDAQHFGVPQRRRRVFVVGHLGDWRRAAAVLFEFHSLQGHSPPRRQAGERVAPTLASRPSGGGGLGTDFDCDGGLIAGTLSHNGKAAGSATSQNAASGLLIPLNGLKGGVSHALTARHSATGRYDPNGETFVAHSLRGGGFDASEDGTGRGTPLVPIAFQSRASVDNSMNPTEIAPTLDVGKAGGMAVAVHQNQRGETTTSHTAGALKTGGGKPGQGYPAAAIGAAVRRLTPRECERLQGFADDYTLVPYRGGMAADGPRYKAIGNSMAVPVMRWIGERIQLVEGFSA